MKWLVVTEDAIEGIGRAVVVEAESQDAALREAWGNIAESYPNEMVCEQCENPYPTKFLVALFGGNVETWEKGDGEWRQFP